MDEGKNLGLLEFLTPSDKALRLLVVEDLAYLPPLRRLYPAAEFHAVAADPAALAAVPTSLAVRCECLDYRETPLPYEKEFFDIIVAERCLDTAVNPQDIAAGFGTFIRPTGFLLTSFANIRYWRVLESLMSGHYYALVRRLFARFDFEILLAASFYKDVFFLPGEGAEIPQEIATRLAAAGFEYPQDMATEVWLVQAWRSTRAVARLKAAYTPAVRRRLVTLCRRIEYGIDRAENRRALRRLCQEEGITPLYLAAFTRQTIFCRAAFRAALAEEAGWEDFLLLLDEAWERSEGDGGDEDEG